MRRVLPMLLLVFVLPVSAQHTLRNYSVREGLPQSQVQIMLEDSNGYLWIGTNGGGLARFDGREFKVYTTLDGLVSNIVTYLKFDEDQNLWIVHPRGITKFDGSTFKKFVQPDAPNQARRIRRLFAVSDTLFFVTAPGHLGKIYRDSVYYWSKPAMPGKIISYSHLLPDKSIMLYLGDSSFLVEGNQHRYRLSHGAYFNRLMGVYNAHDSVWMSTDKGLFLFDWKKKTFHQAKHWISNHVINYDELNDVFWTRKDNMFFKEYRRDGKAVIDTVFRDVDVNQVFHDSEGNTWFATSGTGLYKYFVQDFNRCPSDNVRAIMAIHRDRKGRTWLGSDGRGLWCMEKNRITPFVWDKLPYRNSVNCIAEDPNGVIWVGTEYGLGKFDEAKQSFQWYTREEGLSHITIVNIAFDQKGGMWVGTLGGGLNYFDGKTFSSLNVKNGLRSNVVSASYFFPKGNLYYFGDEFGIGYIYQGEAHYLPIREIENTTVLSIQSFNQNMLLIGSGGSGVVILDPGTLFKKILSTRDGLASDFIYFATQDDEGYIWVGSEKGITRLRLNGAFEIVENLHFDFDSGLTGVETNHNAFYVSGDIRYFGLVDGLYEFNDVRKSNVGSSFDVHMTGLDIFYGAHQADEFADSLSGFYKIPVNPVLPHNKNHVTFHFNKVSKRYPKSVKFKYFLKNFDKTWSQPSSANFATYSNLPPGEYIFQVMATDNQGSWSDRVLSYPIVIKAPFYRTTAFVIAMIVLVVGIIFLVYYLQIKSKIDRTLLMERIRAQEQDALRKEIARDFHDEMGNQLTRIINYVSLLKMNGNGSSHTDLYSKVETSAKYLYSGTRDFIWAIDPVNDELSKLFLHIRDFGEKLFEEKGIDFRAFNDVKRSVRLPYGFSREANLIFKEVMTNSFKHSQAKNVKLELKEEDNQFVFVFEDDGRGFDYGKVQSSNGLRNIRERADRMSAILRLGTSPSGTRVALYFTQKQTIKYGLTI